MESQTKHEVALTGSSMIPSNHELTVYQVMARNAAQSQLYKTLSESQIMMIMLAARELGVPPMLSLNGGINCINGKVELSARLMGNMIRQRGHSFTTKVLNKEQCVLIGKRCDNGDTMEATFTWQDAKEAGLTGKAVWKSYTEDMLYARALSRLARRLFPDVIGTAYVEGEVGGEVIIEKPVIETQVNPVELRTKLLCLLEVNEEDDFLKYVDIVSKHYGWTEQTTMEAFDKDHATFVAKFRGWKAKQASEQELKSA